MKIINVLQRIQSLYSKGVQSDSSRLSFRHIYSVVLSIRATLLTQKINKKQQVSQWNYQSLHCVELIKALPYECPCLPAIGCTILRTKERLPSPITGLLYGHEIQSVTSLDGSITYSETTWEKKKYNSGNKFTKAKADFYIRDGYLYITSNTGPKAITITGLFEDPLEAENYPSICKDKECEENSKENPCLNCISVLDREFPIEKDMLKTLIELSNQELLSIFVPGREDLTNNSIDSPKEESK